MGNSDLVVNQRVCFANFQGLLKLEQCSWVVVHPQVLHSDEKACEMAAREKASCCSVRRHGLLRLVLGREGMTKSYPGGSKVLVQIVGLLEILACLRVLFD